MPLFLRQRMFLLVILLSITIAHSVSASQQNIQDCNLRFVTCSSSEQSRRPVCGSDNLTYQNRCQLQRAQCQGMEVTVQHRGRCKERKLCLAARKHHPLLFVPSCLQDGSFAPVQCHSDTGYCWCVTPKGKPIPNSSVRNARPNCSRRGKANTRRRSSLRGRNQNKGCGREDRTTFNKNLIKIFKTEYNRMSPTPSGQEEQPVLGWKFSSMDKDGDGLLVKPEYRELRRLVKKVVKPKKCAKTFTKLCDLNHDETISKEEWIGCLGIDLADELYEDDGEEKPGLPVIPHGIPGRTPPIDGDSSVERKEEPEVSDCHSDRKAVLEEEKASNSELYVPECTPDGRYQTVQCYKSTGYCWCVNEDNGKPIPGTSMKDQVPKCDSIPAPSRPMPGCPEPYKQTFISELMDLMTNKMAAASNKSESERLPIKEETIYQLSPQVQVATWNFLMLDKNKNKVLERKEWKNLRALVSSKPQLRRCGKRLPRYCDVNHDRKISITEWLNCLNNSIPATPVPAVSRRRGVNPLQIYLKGED